MEVYVVYAFIVIIIYVHQWFNAVGRKGIRPLKTLGSKPLWVAINVSGCGTAQGTLWATTHSYIRRNVWRVSTCPMRTIRIRMNGDWVSMGQPAYPGWPGELLLKQCICIVYMPVLKVKQYSSPEQVISELQGVTCHMGSLSITCQPSQVNSPRLTPARQAGTRFIYTRRMEGWVDLGASVHTEMVYLSADSHPSK